MTSANQQQITSEEVIQLHLRIDELCIRVWLGDVNKLAVDVLLDTSFVDQYTARIFPVKRKLITRHSHPVAILQLPAHWSIGATTVSEIADGFTLDYVAPIMIMVVERTIVQPGTRPPAQVHSQPSSLTVVDSIPFLALRAQ